MRFSSAQTFVEFLIFFSKQNLVFKNSFPFNNNADRPFIDALNINYYENIVQNFKNWLEVMRNLQQFMNF